MKFAPGDGTEHSSGVKLNEKTSQRVNAAMVVSHGSASFSLIGSTAAITS